MTAKCILRYKEKLPTVEKLKDICYKSKIRGPYQLPEFPVFPHSTIQKLVLMQRRLDVFCHSCV